ncbi:Stk1 family PASTA domain-containing Ser/Thr kinase [Streptomyces sp. SID3343]|uniref:Stk1 family PASTA domain-containing Ser/Thr kinase n=2 Tax=Streptomyces sp. SID3343 TaxID=2690260 RepID=UPI00136A2D56|nr:Stk1 family PASTA domain-containing Ser/Thr kinase [Streptomyces sp. SID3343]MYW01823.1 Stk1 family PASTA domain-containing Ser/Thr kinase [Streptomyces sp. SID3343]
MEEPRRLGDRYEIGAVLGRGGMAEVYMGRDIRLGRSVAVKTLRADLARDPTFQARFRREAQSAASLNHPAIVAVYDTGEDYIDGLSIPYIVMEYVDGSTLRELLHSGRRLLPERALEMTAGVLQALEYSHRNGIIHRDIKPANVMLTRQGTVKVMDFGIARSMADNGMTMTQTAAVIGTAQYLSPEQARGETVDARTDLYSTGCLLYELLTERPPFVGDSPVAVAYQHVREDPLPPSTFDPEVSPTIDAIVLKSLAKNPDNRYQSADEMRADLERALHGLPVGAPSVMAAPMNGDPATQYLPPTAAGGATQVIPAHGRAPGTGQYELDDDDRYPDEPRRRSRGGAWILLAIACVAVLVAAFFVGKALMGGDEEKTTATPRLLGLTSEVAGKNAANLDFKINVNPDSSVCADTPGAVQGTVCKQTPEPAAESTKGGTIQVWLFGGPKTVKVPTGLTGLKEAEATAKLKEAGLGADPQSSATLTCERETVCSTDPQSGADAKVGDKVVLKIATGKPQHDMPDVVGSSYEDALAQLTNIGLKVTKTTESEYSDKPIGQVTRQSATKGKKMTEGNQVNLTVSKGPAPATTAPPVSTTPPGSANGNTGGPPQTTSPPNPPASNGTIMGSIRGNHGFNDDHD